MDEGNSITFTNKEFTGNFHYATICLSSLENSSVSSVAVRVHIYFLSKKPNWVFYVKDVCNKLGIDDRTYQRAMLELEEKGYLYRSHNKNRSWKYTRCDFPTPRETIEKQLESGWFLYKYNPPSKMGGLTTPSKMGGLVNKKEKVLDIISKDKSFDEISLSKDKQCVAQKGATQVQRKLLRKSNLKNQISKGLKDQVKPPLKEPKLIAPGIKALLDFQTALGLHKYKPTSKTYFESARTIQSLMKGTLFNGLNEKYTKYKNRKFTFEEIRNVLQRISLAASLDYYPKNKNKIYLKQPFNLLVYNPLISGDFKSNFIYYFENEPKKYGNGISLKDDPKPDITQTYKTFYTQNVIGGVKYEFDNVEENKLREGTKKNMEFLKENKSNMQMSGIDNYITFTRLVIKAIKEYHDDRGEMIEIGTFSSPRTWTKIVPDYLIKQGILRPPLQID